MNDLVERSKALGLENSNLGEWVLRIEALEKQRDELLAALEWAADVLPPSDPYGMGVCDCPVCRAIESVKGGAA